MQILTSFSVLQETTSAAEMVNFVTSLLEVLISALSLSIEYFRQLPSTFIRALNVHLLLLEKEGAPPKINVRNSTESVRGAKRRIADHTNDREAVLWAR